MRCAAVALALCTAAWSPAAAQQPTVLSPEAPRDGASVGAKPRFLLRARGVGDESVRFRIELTRDGFRSIAYVFDQVADPNGWVYTVLEGGDAGAIYLPRRPIGRGDYLWRVAAWDGVSWYSGAARFRLNVDDVPPATVEGLTVRRDLAGACVELTWNPVAVDAEGHAERVAVYHVFRASTPGAMRPVEEKEVAATALTSASDCSAEASADRRLYYRVGAEDEAGNLAGKR